jgi:tripartite-type tricarboxylate transporter receptor subunit TctC
MNLDIRLSRRLLCGGAVALAALVAQPSLAQDAFPSRPISLVIPYAPGGQTDVMARLLAEKLSIALKQPVVAENRPGATGSLAARLVAKASPDGYTLLFGSGGPMSINPVMRKSIVAYDPVADFTPIASMAISPNLIAVNPQFPSRNLAELIAKAKAEPSRIDIGSTAGSGPDMMSALFRQKAGIDFKRVPYPSGAPLLKDVLAGHVPVLIDGVIAAQQLIAAGKLVPIAVSSAQRMPSLPNVPTVAETLPGFESNSWFAVFAPANTPRVVVMKLNAAVNDVLAQYEMKERMASYGAMPVGGSPEKLRDSLAAEIALWEKLSKETGLTFE